MGTTHRVVAYFDVDCFYAQAEMLRRPHLQGRPVGVTQKFLVVTCNYEARQRGVPKMASIQAAKERCPDLVLFNGEDLTPYRAASKKIMTVLGRFGVLERRGLDEAALDITMEVMKRSASSPNFEGFSGHVLGPKGLGENALEVWAPACIDSRGSDYYLMVGSQLVAEIRAAVERETGFRCSSGIATNKMLAKLVSSINKPNKQTCILESAVSGFLTPLHVRKLPGIGHQTESVLKDMGITTVADLQQSTLQQLSTKLGNRMGMLLFDSCRGVDNSLVQDKGPPKSLSVEDSFQPCTSFKQAEEIIRSLAPDLISRLDEDKEEYLRRPKVFTVKWRYPGNWAFKSSSAPMPLELLSACVSPLKRLETVVEIAMKLLSHSLGRQSFSIVVLNIGATSFTANSNGSNGVSHDIRSFLSNPVQPSKQMIPKVVGKREARFHREESEKGRFVAKSIEPVFKIFENDGAWLNNDGQTRDHDMLVTEEEVDEVVSDEDGGASKCYKFTSFIEQPFLQRSLPHEGHEGSSELQPDIFDNAASPLTDGICVNEESRSKALESSSNDSHGMADVPVCVVRRLSPTGARADLLESFNPCQTRNLVSCITDSFETVGDSTPLQDYKSTICEACGQEVQGDCYSKQEHDDYHYALDLNSQEQSLANTYLNPSLSPSQSTRRRQKATKRALHPQSSLKKGTRTQNERLKTQSSILDCFLHRSQG